MSLEVQLDPAVSGGLKVIDRLPPGRPCRLEGRNGIGKSALVRILTLIGGGQPYPGDRGAWQSLRSLIGPTVVTITGLAGAFSTARVVLTPDRWPAEPEPMVGEWLGVVQLDGRDGSVAELAAVLDVVHLTGTEKLQDTLQHQYPMLAAGLAGISRRLEALESARADLGGLADQLQRVSPRAADREGVEAEAATRRRQSISEELQIVVPRAADLSTALALRAVLDSGDVAENQIKLQQLRAQLAEARSNLPAAEADHDAAVAALDAGTGAQQQAARLERRFRTQRKRQDQLSARQAEYAARLDTLGALPDVDVLDGAQTVALALQRERAAARQQQERLRAARRRRSSVENEVLDEVRVVLADALARGLGATVLAQLHGIDLTVADLEAALGSAVALLDGDEDADLDAADAEVMEWSKLEQHFTDKAELAAALAGTESDLAALEPQLAEHDELRQSATLARETLDTINDQIRALLGQIGALSQAGLGGGDVTDAEGRVAELLASHQVDADDLGVALARTQIALQNLQTQDDTLKEQIDTLADNAVRRRVQREALRRRANTDPDHAWLAELSSTLPSAAGPGEWIDETWQTLADHAAAVRHALDQLSSQVEGLQAVASAKAPPGPHLRAVNAVIEHEAIGLLSASPIADALFDGGTLQRVSMEELSITWATPDGQPRTRPLSVFSSGEQALGFMRARLQQIASQPALNRLIFLDEFGAFISADRRRPLAELLTSSDLLGLSDQVVVIFPLQSDYEAELNQTTGGLRELYTRRARAVADHGYFTETFER